MIIKKFILVRLAPLILLFIKMKKENSDISKDIIMKIGLNQVLIPPDFGVDGYYGIYQPLKKVIMTLKEDLIYD